MSRRHTFSNPTSDYPEHLNPFREENTTRIDEGKENQVNGFGHRRNSRLSASFRLNNWPMFSKKSKGSEANADDSTKPKSGKFSTLTPRLSRHIMGVLSPKKSKEKIETIPQYNTLPSKKPDHSTTEFRLIKPNRERFAPRVPAAEPVVEPRTSRGPPEPVIEPRTSRGPPVPEPRVSVPPVPLPRTSLSRAGSTTIEPLPLELAAAATVGSGAIAESANVVESEESKYIRQGARPKKKRQAPLPPPPLAPPINESDCDTARNVADTSQVSDTTMKVSDTSRNMSDTSQLSDTTRNVSDTPQVSDTVRKVSDISKNVLDTSQVSDTTRNVSDNTRNVSDTHQVSDTVRKVSDTSRKVLDTPEVSDTSSNVSDTPQVSDTTRKVSDTTTKVSDIPQVSDTTSNVSDTPQVSETIRKVSDTTRKVSDTPQVSDTTKKVSDTPTMKPPTATLAVEEIDFSVKLFIDDDV